MPPDPTPALSLRGLTKEFGTFRAVDKVDLDIPAGEIFALLGPNGAGKTTLISCITGLSRPTGGTAHVFGHDTRHDFRTTRRLIGLVPQEIAFDPFFTPHESLLIQMGLMGVKPDPDHADELLRRIALDHKRDAYTRNLSGGMKRRLLVAKALVHRPRILFLDEPTAGVDVELRRDLWGEVRRLRDAGTTIILTTHYLEEAEELADRIGVIRDGRLILVEKKRSLMERLGRCSVRLRPETTAPALDSLPFPAAELEDGQIEATWSTPDDLQRILQQAAQHFPIASIEVLQARLEDIFVSLVGHNAPQDRD
ncbi:MAG: ABC transporter ATP-binding protein [Deltaproteobacteria bacterium]|nr:MAG: ABC transporter ATP-binding protein [Deltaproteobacteria bacterium]